MFSASEQYTKARDKRLKIAADSWWKKEEQKAADEKQHQEFIAKLAREPPGDNPTMLEVKKKLELNIKSCENLTLLVNILVFLQERRQEELIVKEIREQTESNKLLKELFSSNIAALVAADLEKIEEVAMPGDDEPPQKELLAALPVPAKISAWSCNACSQQEMAASLSNIEAMLKIVADAKDPQPLKKILKLKKQPLKKKLKLKK
jgi:hypothetical protein